MTQAAASKSAPRLEQGYVLLRDGRLDDAAQWARTLIQTHPGDAAVFNFAAEAALAQGQPQQALTYIQQAIEASGGDPALLVKKAELLMRMRRRQEAVDVARGLGSQRLADPGVAWRLGSILMQCNLFDDAIAQFESAVRRFGEHPALLYDLAVARFFKGDFERAEQVLDQSLAHAPDAGHAYYLRATLRRQTPESNHVDQLRQRLKAGLPHAEAGAATWYALAKELEDLGEHEQSFAALEQGAKLRRSALNYELTSELATQAEIRAAYDTQVIEDISVPDGGEGAIFIVGLPRTGTTLVERLLVQTGSITSAGELLDFGNLLMLAAQRKRTEAPSLSPVQASLQIDFGELGREYMRGAAEAAGGPARFIDKIPINFLYCGMIRKALPKAKIVHLVRDPLDSCYAIFKTFFFNAYFFSYQLEELADYYVGYRDMMRHWHSVMPGQILDVHYEDLVSDTETQARRLVEWCGLEWQPSMLDRPIDGTAFATASAAQVREPVHRRSVGSARRHLDKLEPLVAKLRRAGVL